MSRIIQFVAFFFLIIASGTSCDSTLQDQKKLPWNNASPARRSCFVGSNSAWLTTDKGELVFTHDGGWTWKKTQKDAVGGFKEISFADSQYGWTINDAAQVWKTEDGGIKWGPLSVLENGAPADRLKFADRLHGWAVEPFSLWRTDDGGLTWHREFPFQNPERISEPTHQSCFVSSQKGWLGGERGAVYATTDGGVTWHAQRPADAGADIGTLFFIDAQTGWIGTRPENAIYRTRDGGSTWIKYSLPNRNLVLNSIHFVNQDEGWAAGTRKGSDGLKNDLLAGVILHTTDGGQHWQFETTGTKELVYNRIYFGDARNGWLVARDNVYRTEDGGNTWRLALTVSGYGQSGDATKEGHAKE